VVGDGGAIIVRVGVRLGLVVCFVLEGISVYPASIEVGVSELEASVGSVGLWVGLSVGLSVGLPVGLSVELFVGLSVGLSVVGLSVVGLSVVGLSVVGLSVVGLSVVGLSVVGLSVVGRVVDSSLVLVVEMVGGLSVVESVGDGLLVVDISGIVVEVVWVSEGVNVSVVSSNNNSPTSASPCLYWLRGEPYPFSRVYSPGAGAEGGRGRRSHGFSQQGVLIGSFTGHIIHG